MTGNHILNDQKLSNTTIEKLLKKIFSLNIDENEKNSRRIWVRNGNK